MRLPMDRARRRALRAAGIAALLALLAALLWRPLSQVLGLAGGATAICFVICPLAKRLERRFPRPAASLLALLGAGTAIVGTAWLMLPALLKEMLELGRALPESVGLAADWLDGARAWLAGRLPGIPLPEWNLNALQGALSGLAAGTLQLAANLAGAAGRLSMMAVLAYFFLRDREVLLLRLELLLPQSARAKAVRMGNAALRELNLYLQGQLMIAAAVAALAALALMAAGVRSALVLGILIGILNMIPYFGPFIGGIPAVLIALTDGWEKAAMTVLALTAVQQVDGSLISPRVMASLTGFSPALVLVSIYAGARFGGVAGMLLALPVMMTSRTLVRIFMQ